MQWTGFNDAAHALVLRMADASFRAIVLAIVAAALACLVRRSAAAKHLVWTAVLAGMLALPFLRPIVPAAHVPLPRALTPRALDLAPIRPSAIVLRISAPVPRPYSVPITPWFWIAAAYFTGVALFAARLAGGLVLTRRAFQDTRVIHPALPEYFDRITHADPNVMLQESDSIPVPLTVGLLRTRVILPSNWREWPQAKLDAILAHELAHARRSDPWIAFLASVNTCVFWFHPLAWWLRRRLAVLAEHAADDAALAGSAETKRYALLLLETAAQLPARGRLAWYSAAMTGPVVAQRIRRVLKLDLARWKPLGDTSRALLIVTTAALILLTTAVDNKTLAAPQGPSNEFHPPTAEQAAAWERALAANPDDQSTRGQLIMYYAFHQQPDRAFAHAIWLIDHHPDSEFAGFAPPLPTRDQFDEIQIHWTAQLALHPDDARVLINAAKHGDPQEQIDLLERARKLDPSRGTEPLARLDSQILLQSTLSTEYTGLAAQVRFNVQSSNDIALVGAVATDLVIAATTEALDSRTETNFVALRALATELVTQAQALDPGNRQWSDLMEGVQALPRGR
jgi:beta-lactamase regulating signal transducer with metallopeptidase domain